MIRLIDIDDGTNMVYAEVVSQRLHRVTLRHTWRHGRPFKPAKFWDGNFDIRSGLPLDDRGAFKIHPDDLHKVN